MVLEIPNKVKQFDDHAYEHIDELLRDVNEPLLLKGFVSHWPIVKKAQESNAKADQYLRSFYRGKPLLAFMGKPEIKGRFSYNHDLSGFNFVRSNTTLNQVLDQISEYDKQSVLGASIYIGSTPVDQCLPEFRKENDLKFAKLNPLASIWLGNKTRIAAHYDLPDNIACVVAGKRRFTLFPPEQLENLYIGPIDFTPAGQAISLVDFYEPDYTKFPKFKQAVASASVANLEAGDALFIPSMWWHHVEAKTNFNVLVNYWWSRTPHHMGSPMDALYHAILCIRDLPKEKRELWKQIFDYYIFDVDDRKKFSHIPEQVQGALAELDSDKARKIRALLVNYLRR